MRAADLLKHCIGLHFVSGSRTFEVIHQSDLQVVQVCALLNNQ